MRPSPKVGASGYRIDIGVRHPDWPYGFMMGVECDGATYHSSKSSRDRDRLRQEVLEARGWCFHRIWSTDWFRNPAAEKSKLRERLEARLADLKAEQPRPAEAATAAVPAETHCGATVTHILDRRPTAQPFPVEAKEGPATQDRFASSRRGIVSVGSTVTVETITDGRKLRFRIADTDHDPDNGVVGVHTPIGQALLDAEAGEKVAYVAGSYLREVRVLSVA
jgi:transcription elongation GreA/GreB family factor